MARPQRMGRVRRTDQPTEARRTRCHAPDPGELPLALTAQPDASRGVEEFLARHHPADYNGSWLLTGDPDALFFIDFTGLVEPVAVTLAPGLHVLENRALGVPSPKAERVAASLAAATDAATALTAFRRVLGDHTVAEPAAPTDQPGPESPPTPRSSANCVHLDEYGTRSSCLIRYGADGAHVPPQIWVADGPPCTAPFVDVSSLWSKELRSPR